MSNIARDHNGMFPAFTSIGGYPVAYLCADGGILCAACANGKNGSEASETHEEKQWRLIASDVHWEGDPLTCDHCNAEIESAYGPVGDDCEECGNTIPPVGKSLANRHHADSCSLFNASND